MCSTIICRKPNIGIVSKITKLLHRQASSKKVNQTTAEYCLNSIKTNDYDNFMCTLLLPADVRSCAIAVRAFNVEISKVTQTNVGLMRLQFWQDTVDALYSKLDKPLPQHPVAIELYNAIKRFKLTKRYLTTLISCRADNIGNHSFATLDDLEKYAEQSVSNVYYLLLEGCGVRNIHADHAASHLGKAQGIVQQLRTTPLAKQLNHIALPQSILAKYQVAHEEIVRAVPSKRLDECTFDVAARAYQHLEKARDLCGTVPHAGRCVLLPAIVVGEYLNRLQSVRHNVLDVTLHGRRGWVGLGVRAWWARYKGEY